jgi:penicillin-binding protein-related factor A (putative recombinase)
VIVYFSLFDEFYLLQIRWIDNYVKTNEKKTIKYEAIKQECQLLPIVYPGIINLAEKI